MYLGKIVELAEDQELYQNPQHPYTQALLSSVPIPDPEVLKARTPLEGDVPSPLNPPSGCTFHPRCPERRDVCVHQEPTFRNLGKAHWIACHLR
jgi:oligopeptide transport system ATP-binding protein